MTEFLFSRPNFLTGMGSAVDIAGTLVAYNVSATPAEADSLALSNDWAVVGKDMREAIEVLKG